MKSFCAVHPSRLTSNCLPRRNRLKQDAWRLLRSSFTPHFTSRTKFTSQTSSQNRRNITSSPTLSPLSSQSLPGSPHRSPHALPNITALSRSVSPAGKASSPRGRPHHAGFRGVRQLIHRPPAGVRSAQSVAATAVSIATSSSASTSSAAAEFLNRVLGGSSGMGRDVGAFLFAAIGSLLWVTLFRELSRRGVFDSKLSRKLVHISSGTLFIASWVLFSEAERARWVAACVPFLNSIRLFVLGSGILKDDAAVKSISREGSPSELLQGPLYYAACICVMTVLFWRGSPIGMCALCMMCGGDGLADIIGRRFGGGHKLPFNKDKSWAGSLAMFFGGAAFSAFFIFFFTIFGYLPDTNLVITLQRVLLVALVGTIVESLPIKWLDDNLSVTVMATLTGLVCFR